MKFKKVGNNSIRCLITPDDMWNYGIEMDDLMDDREKANGFLREILAKAYDEVGYVTSGQALSIQMAVLPDGNIDLMISDSSDMKLSQMISMLKEKFQNLGNQQSQTAPFANQQSADMSRSEQSKAIKNYIKARIDVPLWGAFESLDSAIEFASKLSVHEQMPSCLIRYKDKYFLRLECRDMEDHIADIVLTLAEYASEMFTEEQGVMSILEHGELVIADEAVEKLSDLAIPV